MIVLFVIGAYLVQWAPFCGVVWAACQIFGFPFNLALTTGVFWVLELLIICEVVRHDGE